MPKTDNSVDEAKNSCFYSNGMPFEEFWFDFQQLLGTKKLKHVLNASLAPKLSDRIIPPEYPDPPPQPDCEWPEDSYNSDEEAPSPKKKVRPRRGQQQQQAGGDSSQQAGDWRALICLQISQRLLKPQQRIRECVKYIENSTSVIYPFAENTSD